MDLTADEEDRSTLLVATGSGFAPFRALIQAQLQTDRRAPLGVLFGCRTADDILWADERAAWRRERTWFHDVVTLSRPDVGWMGRTGYVQKHLEALVREVAPELVLICGLSPMVDEVEQRALGLGIPAEAIRTEAYDLG